MKTELFTHRMLDLKKDSENSGFLSRIRNLFSKLLYKGPNYTMTCCNELVASVTVGDDVLHDDRLNSLIAKRRSIILRAQAEILEESAKLLREEADEWNGLSSHNRE